MKAVVLNSPRRRQAGFSLAEVIVVIAIIAVLSGVSVVAFRSMKASAQLAVAQNSLETLNQGIHRFNEANYEIYYSGSPGITEMQILRTLQYRNPDNPATGSPYVRPDWNPTVSASTDDYRLVWTGTLYTLAGPGTAGKGLRVDFTGADMGVPYAFPPNFSLAGK